MWALDVSEAVNTMLRRGGKKYEHLITASLPGIIPILNSVNLETFPLFLFHSPAGFINSEKQDQMWRDWQELSEMQIRKWIKYTTCKYLMGVYRLWRHWFYFTSRSCRVKGGCWNEAYNVYCWTHDWSLWNKHCRINYALKLNTKYTNSLLLNN